ncbi:MAG: hypothetical protein GY861_07080 [bacterium]|nr:hypothetical protein [bacterium]
MKKIFLLFLFALVVPMCVEAVVYDPACGSTVTDDVILTQDMSCPATALTIGADDITVDCQGYSILFTGSPPVTAITLNDRSGVSIENCGIYDYTVAISLSSSSDNTIKNITSNSRKIYFGSSSYNTVLDSVFTNFKIEISGGSHNNLINNNLSSDNLYGFDITSSPHTLIVNNSVSGHFSQRALSLVYSDYSNVIGNVINGSSARISLHSSYNNFTNNVVLNGEGIKVSGNSNILSGNVVKKCFWGLTIYSNSENNVISNNDVSYSSDYDISGNDEINYGYNNSCDLAINWNDEGEVGCTHPSPTLPPITIDSCRPLNEKRTYLLDQDIVFSYDPNTPICFPILSAGVTIDCQGHSITGEDQADAIYGYDQKGFTMKNCLINNFRIGVSGSFVESKIIDNTIENCSHSGIYLRQGQTTEDISEKVTISENIINNSGSRGINLQGVEDCLVSNNLIKNTIAWQGIYASNGAYINITNNTLISNFGGIEFYWNPHHNRIINNTMIGTLSGVGVFTNASYNFIDGNKVSGGALGIAVGEHRPLRRNISTYNVITNNKVFGNDLIFDIEGLPPVALGIGLGDGAHNNLVRDNDVYGNGVGLFIGPLYSLQIGDPELIQQNIPQGNEIYHNNIYDNIDNEVASTMVFFGVDPNHVIEVSHNGQGNWWGRTSEPYFIAGTDSNGVNVVDSYAYGAMNGWSLVCSDSDGDGYGVCPDCGIASGCTYDGDDCDDINDTINPGATEICDGADNNCDSVADEGLDNDGDNIANCFDTCQEDFNPDNSDIDEDGAGDVCDVCPFDAGDACDVTEAAASNVDESGGTIISDSSNVEIDVQANALSEDTSISVTGVTETSETDIATFQLQTGVEAVSLIYSFGPEGVNFADPYVTITLRYDDSGIDEGNIDIYFFNSATETWEAQGASCDTIANECELTVTHFSDYIVGAFIDSDGDGYSSVLDCDDSDAEVYPGASDVCDGIDNDCDEDIDEDYVSTPTTCGIGACASDGTLDCVEGVEVDSCTEGAPAAEECNGIDDNCDGVVDDHDQIAPVTTSDAPVGWENDDVSVTLTATDDVCGVGETYYCVDSADTCTPDAAYTGSVLVSGEGIHYIRYFSTDNSEFNEGGNVEEIRSSEVKIDNTEPVASIEVSDASDTECNFFLQFWIDDGVVSYDVVHGCAKISANIDASIAGLDTYTIKLVDSNDFVVMQETDGDAFFNFDTDEAIYKILLEAYDNAGNYVVTSKLVYEDDDNDVSVLSGAGGAPDLFDLCPAQIPNIDTDKDGCEDYEGVDQESQNWCIDTYTGRASTSLYPTDSLTTMGDIYTKRDKLWYEMNSHINDGVETAYAMNIIDKQGKNKDEIHCKIEADSLTTSAGETLIYVKKDSAKLVYKESNGDLKVTEKYHTHELSDGSKIHANMKYKDDNTKLHLVYENKDKEKACKDEAKAVKEACKDACDKDKNCKKACDNEEKDAKNACGDNYKYQIKEDYSGYRTLSLYDILNLVGYE